MWSPTPLLLTLFFPLKKIPSLRTLLILLLILQVTNNIWFLVFCVRNDGFWDFKVSCFLECSSWRFRHLDWENHNRICNYCWVIKPCALWFCFFTALFIQLSKKGLLTQNGGLFWIYFFLSFFFFSFWWSAFWKFRIHRLILSWTELIVL